MYHETWRGGADHGGGLRNTWRVKNGDDYARVVGMVCKMAIKCDFSICMKTVECC